MNNPDELAGLPEDVREAFKLMDKYQPDWPKDAAWVAVRAELLRLARENKELRDSLVEYVQGNGKNAIRAERAEAELAALKRRIAEAPTGRTYWLEGRSGIGLTRCLDDADVGQCFALLPVGVSGGYRLDRRP